MNAYEKSQQLGLTGSDATVFSTIQAMGLTHIPINRAELVFNLNLLGMLQKVIGNNASEKWRGTILTMQDAVVAGGTTQQQAAVALWLSHITNPTNIQWDTTNPVYAAGFWGMYLEFKDQPGMPTTADFTAIAALGGGWIATTVQDFTAQRVAAENAIAAAAAAEEEAAVMAQKQAALAEATDTAIHAILDDSGITQNEVLAAFTTRLAEVWS